MTRERASKFFYREFLNRAIFRNRNELHPHTQQEGQAVNKMVNKRKHEEELALLRVRLATMSDIVKRMREAHANREYDKMPGLKKEQDTDMGR